MEHLYKLISHEDPVVRRNAIMVFGIMSSNSKSFHFLIFFNVYEYDYQNTWWPIWKSPIVTAQTKGTNSAAMNSTDLEKKIQEKLILLQPLVLFCQDQIETV